MDFADARLKMVDNQIRTTDVTDLEILRAFLAVPREVFVEPAQRALAYVDLDLAVSKGRSMMQPAPLAKLLQLARVRPTDVVLDVGCGTGYSSAVLSELAASVVALEEDADLAARATEALSANDFHSCVVVQGPLNAGWPAEAPYDVIVFQGSVEFVPDTFLDQLKERGRLVTVEGIGLSAMAKLYSKDDGLVSDRFGFNCAARPLPGFAREKAFVF